MFDLIPFEGKLFLRDFAEMGQKVINQYQGRGAFKNELRNKLFSKELKRKMGFTNMKTKFEYSDISIIPLNVILNRYMEVSD